MEERLRKFARLVDIGSFTAASRELHISQPALSVAMHKLERELRVELLVRTSRHLKLTEAGSLAYEAARELGSVSSNLSARIAALAGERPTITLGMIDSVASIVFSSATNIDDIERLANISIIVNNSRYLRRGIERNEIDIAFVTALPGKDNEASTIATEPLVLVCHTSQVAAMRRELQDHKLPRFISYDRASVSHSIVSTGLKALGIYPEPRFFSTSPDVMLKLTLLQKGSTVLPYWLVKDALSRQELSLLGKPRTIIIERQIIGVSSVNAHPVIPYKQLMHHVATLLGGYDVATRVTLRAEHVSYKHQQDASQG